MKRCCMRFSFVENKIGESTKYEIELAIYGAKSLALGTYHAIRKLYPEHTIRCFLVTSLQNNPHRLAGLPVKEIEDYSREARKDKVHILIATPQDIHPEIIHELEKYSFSHYTCMDSRKESTLMERYFSKIGKFPSLHALPIKADKASLEVFMARFHKDKPLKEIYTLPSWLHPLQVGSGLTKTRVAEYLDSTGCNISEKNPNYCELTGLYWLWKNRLVDGATISDAEYYGLFHYRRILDITDIDLKRISQKDVDVILQFPTFHEPDIREHHTRYVRESDWEAMLQALQELQPEYAKAFSEISKQVYFYNYNLIIARKQVLADYCGWLFPILERTESLSVPRGWDRGDRYIGYLGENLMTLYFLYHQKDLKIYHTGRLMLT